MGEIFASVRAYVASLGAFAGNALGSRFFVAVAALFCLTFATQSVFAAHRLPPIATLPLAQLGLVAPIPQPNLLPEVKEQLDAAIAAANPYAQDAKTLALGVLADPEAAKAINYGGTGATFVLLLLGLVLQGRKARRPDPTVLRWWAPTT